MRISALEDVCLLLVTILHQNKIIDSQELITRLDNVERHSKANDIDASYIRAICEVKEKMYTTKI